MQLLTGSQIRMSRAHLRWSIQELADRAGVATTTIKKLEKTDQVADVRPSLNEAVRGAIVATGRLRFEGNCVCVVGDD